MFFLPFVIYAKSIDCSKVDSGIVTVKSTTARVDKIDAISEAFGCFSKGNSTIKKEIDNVIKNYQKTNPTINVKISEITILELESWNSSRLSYQGELGGEGTYLVFQVIRGFHSGSSLFEGVVANAIFSFKLEETVKFELESDSMTQLITVQFTGPVEISEQKF